jgi:hypothetical protein
MICCLRTTNWHTAVQVTYHSPSRVIFKTRTLRRDILVVLIKSQNIQQTLKVKTQLYYRIERWEQLTATCLRPLTGHYQVVHTMKRVGAYTVYNVTSVWWRDFVHRIIHIITKLTLILLIWRTLWTPNSITVYSYIQQDATLHSLFISGNCSKCFGWYFHPSSGAHTTLLWVAYATHSTLHPVPTFPR